MRVIPTAIPEFDALHLPAHLGDVANLRNGIVLVTGPTSSGKSSTVAALLDRINRERDYHIITIEDPIEFLHNHKRSTMHQRELHSDTPNFALALRAALRQAPKVIFVGEMRDRETIEMVLEAADMGLIVFSTLNTIDASKTVERIASAYSPEEQKTVRERFAKTFRFIISQRLIPSADGHGRLPVFEVLKVNRAHPGVRRKRRARRQDAARRHQARRVRWHAVFRQRGRQVGPQRSGRPGDRSHLRQQCGAARAGTGEVIAQSVVRLAVSGLPVYRRLMTGNWR